MGRGGEWEEDVGRVTWEGETARIGINTLFMFKFTDLSMKYSYYLDDVCSKNLFVALIEIYLMGIEVSSFDMVFPHFELLNDIFYEKQSY